MFKKLNKCAFIILFPEKDLKENFDEVPAH